jgi:hypothetical protein
MRKAGHNLLQDISVCDCAYCAGPYVGRATVSQRLNPACPLQEGIAVNSRRRLLTLNYCRILWLRAQVYGTSVVGSWRPRNRRSHLP